MSKENTLKKLEYALFLAYPFLFFYCVGTLSLHKGPLVFNLGALAPNNADAIPLALVSLVAYPLPLYIPHLFRTMILEGKYKKKDRSPITSYTMWLERSDLTFMAPPFLAAFVALSCGFAGKLLTPAAPESPLNPLWATSAIEMPLRGIVVPLTSLHYLFNFSAQISYLSPALSLIFSFMSFLFLVFTFVFPVLQWYTSKLFIKKVVLPPLVAERKKLPLETIRRYRDVVSPEKLRDPENWERLAGYGTGDGGRPAAAAAGAGAGVGAGAGGVADAGADADADAGAGAGAGTGTGAGMGAVAGTRTDADAGTGAGESQRKGNEKTLGIRAPITLPPELASRFEQARYGEAEPWMLPVVKIMKKVNRLNETPITGEYLERAREAMRGLYELLEAEGIALTRENCKLLIRKLEEGMISVLEDGKCSCSLGTPSEKICASERDEYELQDRVILATAYAASSAELNGVGGAGRWMLSTDKKYVKERFMAARDYLRPRPLLRPEEQSDDCPSEDRTGTSCQSNR